MRDRVTKHIYLIRHGNTDKNGTNTHQSPDEPLNERGHTQAIAAGERLKTYDIDTLLTSDMERARETAERIGVAIGRTPQIVSEFREFAWPHSLYNKSHYSFASLRYLVALFFNRSNPEWNYEGAENAPRMYARVEDAKARLLEEEGVCIAVVTHSIFMSFFLYALRHG